MYRIIMAVLAACLLLTGTAGAREFTVIRTDSSQWPLVRVVVLNPAESASVSEYTLKAASTGKEVTASSRVELAGLPRTFSLVVAMDTSRSLSPAHFEAAQGALSRYLDQLGENEQVALLAFDDKVQLATGFTDDRETLKANIAGLRLEGQRTKLYRAMLYGVELLKNIPGEHALLVITDGKDEGSAVTRNQVAAAAWEAGVRIFCIALPSLPAGEPGKYFSVLEDLARDTGGLFRRAESAEELGKAAYELLVAQREQAAHVHELVFDMSGAGVFVKGDQKGVVIQAGVPSVPVSFAVPGAAGVAETIPVAADRAEDNPSKSVAVPAPLVVPAADTASPEGTVSAPPTAPATAAPQAQQSFWERNWLWLLALLFLLALILHRLRRIRDARFAASKPFAGEAPPRYLMEFPEVGLSFPMRPGTMIMGAGPKADICVDAPGVAEVHAEFCIGETCEIRKTDPAQGVLLNGKRVVKPTRLWPGDELFFGKTRAVIMELPRESDDLVGVRD